MRKIVEAHVIYLITVEVPEDMTNAELETKVQELDYEVDSNYLGSQIKGIFSVSEEAYPNIFHDFTMKKDGGVV